MYNGATLLKEHRAGVVMRFRMCVQLNKNRLRVCDGGEDGVPFYIYPLFYPTFLIWKMCLVNLKRFSIKDKHRLWSII